MDSNYSYISQIGKGACGSVFLVRHTDSKKLFALKQIQLDESRKTRTKAAVLREARILAGLRHPHIVTYHDSFFDDKEEHLCIIQDYCDGGTLEDLIKEADKNKSYLPEKDVVQWFLQVAMAVRYMHSKKVLHRDLKASNVFMNKDATLCKIGDFGIAKSMDTMEVASTCVGTPCYLSPEMCQDIPYSSKADIWALGCMLYEMLALKPAFDANNLVSLFYKIVKGEYDPLPDSYSDDMLDLVDTILVKTPEDRPTARGLLALPFLKTELLRFIEEKENLLEQQRLPTRQGSRPYSTPNLARFTNFLGKERKDPVSAEEAAKRATSCRPNIVNRKERSILISAKPSTRTPRVTTIPEETEEQMNDKGHRSDIDLAKTDSPRSPRHQKVKGHGPKVNEQVDEGHQLLDPTVSSPRETKNHDNSHNQQTSAEKDSMSNESDNEVNTQVTDQSQNKNSKDPLISKEKNQTNLAKIDLSNLSAKEENDKYSENQKVLKLDLSKVNHKDNLDFREFDMEVPKRHKIQEPMRTPRTIEPRTLIIQADPPPPPIQTVVPSPAKHTHDKKPVTSSTNSSTPTGGTPTPTSNHGNHTTSVSAAVNNAHKTRKKPPKPKKNDSPKKIRDNAKSHKTEKKRSNVKDSHLRVPSDKLDYYSDDFDDTLSEGGSDIVEEIPEEIPDWRRMSARSNHGNTLTQTFEIPEIEEDLPDGLLAEDEDEFNDFADDDITEDLDEIVTIAKRECDNLNTPELPDDVVVDDRRPNTSKMIRNHCMNDLGREKYDKVRKFFENNEEPEIKKIEKAIGKEHSKTIYLMTEISKKKKLGHS